MAIDIDHASTFRRLKSANGRSQKAVPIAVICTAILTMVGAGLAVAVGPRGFASTSEQFSPLREAALRVAGGSRRAGAAAIRANGCADCHTIPGISRSQRHPSGPSLEYYADRPLIAGSLQNRPENLVIWLQEPKRFTSDTHEASRNLDSRTASNIAAYLYRN